MTEAFIRGVIAGYGIAIPVGAIAVLIIDAGMRRGFRHGFAAGAGAATADFLYACLAAGAGAVLVPLVAPIAPHLRLVSGLVLVALAAAGFLSLRRRSGSAAAPEAPARSSMTFARFLALTIVNPLTVVYFAALVMGAGFTSASPAGLAAFAAGAFLASLSWQTLLAAAGAWAHATVPPSFRTVTGVVGHMIVLVFGAVTLAGALPQVV